MKNISILGSTGSIGVQTMDVIRKNRDKFNVVGITSNKNIDLLYEQIMEFTPSVAVVMDEKKAKELKERLNGDNTEILAGMDGLKYAAKMDEADLVLISVVGMVGLLPTLEAIKCGKDIALANKETLVAGGAVVKKALEKSKSHIIPVDSEHSAIFQCLQCGNRKDEVKNIILTASGGPFRGKSREELRDITPEKALKHPKWNMGQKISIDSATLMNKGLEVIEAHWLFDMDFDRIDIIVHPESIVHSMVEYIDGCVIAQLGITDMRNPILYALGYPQRLETAAGRLNLADIGKLTFEKPDRDTFKSIELAYSAGIEGGTMPAVLNAANEVAVELFLKGIVKFLDIPDIVEKSMMYHINIQNPDINDIIEADSKTRNQILKDLRVVC